MKCITSLHLFSPISFADTKRSKRRKPPADFCPHPTTNQKSRQIRHSLHVKRTCFTQYHITDRAALPHHLSTGAVISLSLKFLPCFWGLCAQIYPSNTADTVAIRQTMMALYSTLTNEKVNGSKKSKVPVALFIPLCTAANCPRRKNPTMRLVPFITAIRIIHHKSQIGIASVGSSFIMAVAANIKSATVSNFAPNALADRKCRATAPSAISVSPQSR